MLFTVSLSIFTSKNKCFVFLFLFFFVSVNTTAQNLIVNGDFGTFNAGVTNPAKVGYQSDYNQIAYNAGNSVPRQYAITNNPRTVNTTNFQNLTDHTTGDGTGNMMVVDGDNNEIFWKQDPNRQLVGGQTYTFSFWVRNVNNVTNGGSPAPVIRFNPRDCSVCSPQTQPVIGTAWQLFTFTITTATTQFVRIELSTVNAGGGGNDFAIDDISLFAPPAPLSISNSLTNPSCPGISDGVIVAYPNGGLAPFSYTLAGAVTATNSTGVFQGLSAGVYTVSVTDSNSPATTRTTPNITVSNPLDITLSSSPTGCILSGTPITLTAANGGASYSWSASTGVVISDTDAIANVSPFVTTTYTVSSTTVSPTTSANLIGNPSFENGTSGFFSDYGYSLTNTSGTQFAYGIVTNPNSWFSGFVSSSDHTTGNGTGKMLVADGATVANSVIWSQTIPVETSKIYNFSFWAQNLVAASPAQFQVLINGTPITITPLSATNGSSSGWTQIQGTWNSNSATIAIIKIIDTNIASGGNDFALDDISFSTTTSKSCNLSTDLTVNIGGSAPVTNFSYATPFCKDSTNPSPTGATGYVTGGTYTDDNATGLLSINASTGVINLSASTSGTYTIRYSVAANPGTCQSAGSSTTVITINNTPTLSGTLNVCNGLTTTVAGSGTPNATNPWVSATPAVATISNLGVVTGVSAGASVITYEDNNGCTATTSVTVNDVPTISGTLNVCNGSTTNLMGTGTPDVSVPWTSATPSVATVDSSGLVSGVSAGTSLINYKNSNGCFATETVTVNATPILAITCGTATGSSVSFNWNSIVDATSYSYSYSINSGAAVTGVLSAATTSFTVNGLTPGQNVSIILTPTGSVCANQATSNCVSSNCPTPIVDVISDFPSCANDNVSIPTFTSATNGVTFNWTNTNTSIGIAATGSGASIPMFTILNTTNILQTATISVTANDGACTGPSMIFNIDVYPSPTVSIIAAKPSVCSGQATTINFNGTPNTTVTYNVDSGADQFLVLDASGNASLPTGNLTSNTIYSLISVLNPITNCSQTQSGTATITINALPTVTISGTTAVCSGTGTTISFNGTPNATVAYTVNSGVNQTILLDVLGQATLPSGNLIANTDYNLVSIVDTNSCSQLQTGNATIIVDALPTVTISGTTSICSGTGTSILFNGTQNAIVTYTINSGTNQTVSLDGSGNASLPTGNLTSDARYSLVSVQDLSTTCFQTQSGNATVNIISLPTATISGTTTICSGTSTSIQFTGTPNATVTYTINSGINQTVNLDAIGNADITTGNLITTTDYSLVSIEDSTKSCSQPQSGTTSVSINPLPTATISGSTAICSGTGTSIQFNGTPEATVTYIVNSGPNQIIVLDASGQAILPTGNLISNTIYILVSVSDSSTSCSQLQSGTASVTINALPIVTISGTTDICSGASATITFTGTPNATVTYTVDSVNNLTIDLDPAGEATLATGNLIANTTYSLIDILDSTTTCSQLQSGTATVNINAAPDVIPATINQPICSGQSSGVLLTSTTSGTIFNWTVIESGVIGATLGTGNNISQVLNTTSPINIGTAEYTVTPTANGCSGLPVVITVSVSPTPTAVATPDKDVICSGDRTAIALSSGNTQTTFSWNAIQNNVTGATQDFGNAIAQVLQSSLNNFGEAVYAITPSLNGCIGATILVPITVNPVPNVSTNVFNNPICSGNVTNIEITSNVPGTNFNWSVAQTNVIGAVPGNGNSIAQIIETTGTSIGIAEYTITPQINSCIGNAIIVPIQVNPTPEVFGPASTTICSGESPKISLIPLINGTSFSWTQLSDKVTGSSDGNGDKIDQILVAENSLGKVEYTVTPSLRGCSGTPILISVNVNPAPSVNLENGVLCLEVDGTLKKSLILETNLSTNSYDFEWFFNNSISPISGATDSSFEAKELGDYYVNVRFKSTGCSIKSNTSTVIEVNPTNSFNVIVSDAFTEVATITVTGQNGITTYLYQIDDGALQTSNVFNGIGAGNYSVRVTDSDGCTDYSEPVLVIDYPKYFTPNGDGFNDTWNIKGLSDQSNTKLLIYDRYGKLLKQISPKGQGWDGTFNGVQLPATDYWFTVDYVEPNNDLIQLFKAHFSLKR